MDLLPTGMPGGQFEPMESSSTGSKRCRFSAARQASLAFESLYLFRKSGTLCDVLFLVGDKRLSAHRCVLASSCSYFEAMFTGEMVESKQQEIAMNDVDEEAFEQLLDFMYTSQIIIEEANVQQLLPVACMLQLTNIQDACCSFLRDQLDPTNCLGIRRFADTHACTELLHAANAFTQQRFQEVVGTEEFLTLPHEQLIDIISSDELNVRGEEKVFESVMSWIRYDMDSRGGYLAETLEHIRFPLMSPKFLVSTVSADPLIRSSEIVWSLIDEAKNYLLLPQERPLMQSTRTKPRKATRSGEVLFAVGGWCSGDAIATCERFNPINQEWRMVAPMSKRRCGVGVAVLNELLYAVGGHDGQSYLNTVERYDPKTNQWSTDVAPTSSSRTSVGVAVLNNYIYAVGGQDGISCLNFVEKYDPSTNKWSKVASMSSRRLGVGVAVLAGALYAVGGSDGSAPLNTVERYNPEANKWTYVAPMCTRRKHLGVAVYQNQLWAVGGRDDNAELSSVEVYNPETNSWKPCLNMTSRRSGVGLSVVNAQLMAVGGFDGSTYLKSVEVYDSEQQVWRNFTSMNYRRLGGGLGVLRLPQNDLDLADTAKNGTSPNGLSNLKLLADLKK